MHQTTHKGVISMEKIIIFGTGFRANQAYPFLRVDHEVLAFADNNPQAWGTMFYGLPVISAEQIKEYDADEVVIAIENYGEVATQLEQMGIENIRRIRYNRNRADDERVPVISFRAFNIYGNRAYHSSDFLTEKERFPRPDGKGKKVLMIAYSFPPEGGPAVQRTLKFAKYLPEFGYTPVILTTGRTNKQFEDKSLELEFPSMQNIIRIEDTYQLAGLISENTKQELFDYLYYVSGSEKWMSQFGDLQWKEMPYILPDARLFWEIECLKHLDEHIDMSTVDVVYSTAPSYSQLLLGAALKKKYHIPWVGDYRDLWTSDERYYHTFYPNITDEIASTLFPLEKKLAEKMDAIIVAGESWADGFIKNFGIDPAKITAITNGYDEEDFKNITYDRVKGERFTLCYNGTLHLANRDPLQLLRIVNSLIDAKQMDGERVCLKFNGKVKENYLASMQNEDRYHIVQTNGIMTHSDSIQSALDSDLMVFYGVGGENGEINYPGKFYEYLRFGRPILSFSGHNSFQERVLKETGLGENFDYDEENDIKEYILKQYREWENSSHRKNLKSDKITRFERRYLTGKLSEVFDRVYKEWKHGG